MDISKVCSKSESNIVIKLPTSIWHHIDNRLCGNDEYFIDAIAVWS